MNKTQCPHCFTVYVISDAQLEQSQGMVRCGTCRERFEATLLNANPPPRTDFSESFIEPLSEAEGSGVDIDDFIGDPPSFSFKQIDSSTEQADSSFLSSAQQGLEGNLNSELSIEIEDDVAQNMDEGEIAELEKALQRELKLAQASPGGEQDEPESESIQSEATFDDSRESQLISQVDDLVKRKIIADDDASSPKLADEDSAEQAAEQQEFSAVLADTSKPRTRGARVTRAILALLVLLSALLLSATLIYQLWLKQVIAWPDSNAFQQQSASALAVAKQGLEAAQIELPVRRNLSQLELVSAITEAHPTRPSTVLLRVSLINHAQIEQPLPWLELSLTNPDGRLVSRRNLAPQDYIYNNRSDASIGPRQLKRVTIELLAFPEHATGYEVRLLNK